MCIDYLVDKTYLSFILSSYRLFCSDCLSITIVHFRCCILQTTVIQYGLNDDVDKDEVQWMSSNHGQNSRKMERDKIKRLTIVGENDLQHSLVCSRRRIAL